MSIFNNESILAWLKYFSDHSEIDLSTVRILDITGENRNLLPTVQANRSVLVFTDGNHPEIFYSMWDEGMGDCEIWYNEGSEPQGPMKHNLLSEMIDRGVNVSAAMLINNPRAHSGYRIGLDNDSFSPGTIRYVAPEIRAVILKKLCLDEKETICCVSGESIAVEAAIAQGRPLVGVDKDQQFLAPKLMLTSIIKRADRAVFEIVKATAQGAFAGNEIITYDLANGGVDIVPPQVWARHAGVRLPAAIERRLGELRLELTRGGIRLPSLRDRTLCNCR